MKALTGERYRVEKAETKNTYRGKDLGGRGKPELKIVGEKRPEENHRGKKNEDGQILQVTRQTW